MEGIEFVNYNGQKLDLCGAKVQITLINPLFDTDGLPRAFTNQFSIDITPHNAEMFGFAHRLDSPVIGLKIPYHCYLGGLPLFEGFIQLEERTDTQLKLSFQTKVGEMADALEDVNLQHLDLGTDGVTIVNDTIYEAYVTLSNTPTNYNLGLIINDKRYESYFGLLPLSSGYATLYILINNDYPGACSLVADANPLNTSGFKLVIDMSLVGEYDVVFDSPPIAFKVYQDNTTKKSYIAILANHFVSIEGRIKITIILKGSFFDFVYDFTHESSIEEAYNFFITEINRTFNTTVASMIFYENTATGRCYNLMYLDLYSVWDNIVSSLTPVFDVDLSSSNSIIQWNVTTTPATYAEKVRDAWTAKMAAYTPTNGDLLSYPTIKNANLYEGENSLFKSYINYYDNGAYGINVRQPSKKFKFTLVPLVNVKSVLEAIARLGDITLVGAFFSQTETLQLVIYNINTLDEAHVGQPMGYHYLNTYKPKFTIADHLPDYDAIDFWKEFKEFFCLAYFFDNNTLEAIPRRDILNTPTIEWTRQLQEGYTYEALLDEGTTFELTQDEDDTFSVAGQLAPIVIGDGKGSVKPEIGTLHDTVDIVRPPLAVIQKAWGLPHANQIGNSTFFDKKEQDFTPRILFSRGMVNDFNGNPYPYASYRGLAYRLEWGQADGMYETFWREWREFINKGKEVKLTLYLSVFDIHQIKDFRLPNRSFFYTHGQVRGIVKRISFSADEISISKAKVELHTF